MRPLISTVALLAAIVAASPASLAQMDATFGVRAGLNVSTLAGADIDDAEARLGLLAGAYTNIALSPTFSIQPEVLFSQQGANFPEEVGEGSFAINYLAIPVLVNYRIPTGTNLVPRVYAGPQLSLKLGEEARVGGQVADLDLVRGTDFGLTFGADVGALIAGHQRQQFGVGLRYTLGLTNVFDPDRFGEVDNGLVRDIDAKNRVFSVSAYFTF